MIETHARKRLEIVVDEAALREVVTLVEKAGAQGYTVVPGAFGKGQRGVRRGHDIFAEGQNALVVVIASEDVVARILPGLMTLFESFAGIATVSDVAVVRADRF